MYKRILVPVDGSRTSTLGVEHALRLARDQSAQLLLLHVVDEFVAVEGAEIGGSSGDLLDLLERNGEAILRTAAELVERHGQKAETSLRRTIGRVGDAVVDEAATWKADLVVMGTHGRRGIRRMMLGSDAEYVVRHASVPVLLVRPAS